VPLYQVWCFTGKALYNVVGLVMAAAKWAILSRLAQTLVGKLLPHHLPGPGQARIQLSVKAMWEVYMLVKSFNKQTIALLDTGCDISVIGTCLFLEDTQV